MNDLLKIETHLKRLKEQLQQMEATAESLRQEAQQLEQARQVILRLRGGEPPASGNEPSDWATLSIAEAARRVLKEAGGEPLHFAEIAKRAVEAGFRTRGKIPHADAFRRRMGERKKGFRSTGEGRYRLE